MGKASDRRKNIINLLLSREEPISGSELARIYNISRQVVVSDIAVLKEKNNIISTNRGYKIEKGKSFSRIIKVRHKNEDIEKELNEIVDLGAIVRDVNISHKAYGKISIPLDIKSRRDVKQLLKNIEAGVSKPLNNLTEGYHYHLIEADSEEILDEVEEKLKELNFFVEK